MDTGWFRRHFALGVIISGTLCSVLAWMLIEWKWPWFLAPLNSLVAAACGWLRSLFNWLVSDVPVPRWWHWSLIVYFLVTLAGLGYLVLARFTFGLLARIIP